MSNACLGGIAARRTQWLGIPICLVLLASCSSPTAFDPERALEISVAEAVASLQEDSVQIEFELLIANLGNSGVYFMHRCREITLLDEDSQQAISFPGVPCIGWPPWIARGEVLGPQRLELSGPIEQWSGPLDGEYRVRMVFWNGDGGEYAHATSGPFHLRVE